MSPLDMLSVGEAREGLSSWSPFGQQKCRDGLRARPEGSHSFSSTCISEICPPHPSAENTQFCLQCSRRTWTCIWHNCSVLSHLLCLYQLPGQCQFLACLGLLFSFPKGHESCWVTWQSENVMDSDGQLWGDRLWMCDCLWVWEVTFSLLFSIRCGETGIGTLTPDLKALLLKNSLRRINITHTHTHTHTHTESLD